MKRLLLLGYFVFISVIIYSQNIFPTTGNVGIGTTSPNAKLTVQSQSGDNSVFSLLGSYNGSSIFSVNQESSDGFVYVKNALGAVNAKISGYYASNSYFNALGGNVGIGTTTPAHLLNISSSSTGGTVFSLYNTVSQIDNRNWAFKTNASSYGDLGFFVSSGQGNNPETGTIPFLIKANGNIGIGTILPTQKLDVNGNAAISGSITAANFSGGVYPYNSNFGYGADATETAVYAGSTSGYKSYVGVYGGGSGSGSIVTIGTSSTERLRITSNGNVGIGTTAPASKTDILQEIRSELYGTDNPFPNVNLTLRSTPTSKSLGNGTSMIFTAPANADGSNEWGMARILGTPDNSNSYDARGALFLQVRDLYNPGVGGSWNWRNGLVIRANGNIGIGTSTPQNKLDVLGVIRCTEVKVEAPWADFVFKPTYKLRTLSEVEQFIKANNHLPDVPSEKEVKENGISLGEMNAKLLQKIEELTLYMIEMKKENDNLKERVNKLEKTK